MWYSTAVHSNTLDQVVSGHHGTQSLYFISEIRTICFTCCYTLVLTVIVLLVPYHAFVTWSIVNIQ